MYLVLALGAAMVVGNGLALIRPPQKSQKKGGALSRAPLGRTLVMIAIGLLAAIWAIATLTTS